MIETHTEPHIDGRAETELLVILDAMNHGEFEIAHHLLHLFLENAHVIPVRSHKEKE